MTERDINKNRIRIFLLDAQELILDIKEFEVGRIRNGKFDATTQFCIGIAIQELLTGAATKITIKKVVDPKE